MNVSSNYVEVEFDKRVHSQSSLLRVAYAMADRIALELKESADRYVLRGTRGPEIEVAGVIAEIRICAVDFALREEIEARTSGIRETIWRAAFAETVGTIR
jgi:His-Xaa-Ser system protein HxsD